MAVASLPTERKRRRQDEFRLSCVVADYLARALPADALWTHFPAGESRSQITGARLKRMGLARGWPDYLIIWRGQLLGIELKAKGGVTSVEQCAIARGMIENGFRWIVVHSLEQVEHFLAYEGIPLRATVLARAT